MVENTFTESVVNKQFSFLLSPSQRQTFISRLTPSQLLEGEVERSLSDRTFLINFMGSKVIAQSMIPLKPGQQIQLRVVQTHPRVLMNLVAEEIPVQQKVFSLIRSYLPLQVDWGELIKSLSEILTDKELYLLEMVVEREVLKRTLTSLSSLSFDEDTVGNSKNIKQFIERSGLSYESKLKQSLLSGRLPRHLRQAVENDLKGLLLELSHKLEDAAGRLNESRDLLWGGKIREFLGTVNSSIKRIELHQLVNYLTTRNDQQLVLQIPLVLPEGLKTAELYIQDGHPRGKKDKSKQDDFYIVFLLAMRGLGELRIDTHLFKKKISCKIQVGNEEAANFVKRRLAKLSKRLASLDYQVEKLECIVNRGEAVKKDLPLQGFSLLEMRLLDIVV